MAREFVRTTGGMYGCRFFAAAENAFIRQVWTVVNVVTNFGEGDASDSSSFASEVSWIARFFFCRWNGIRYVIQH